MHFPWIHLGLGGCGFVSSWRDLVFLHKKNQADGIDIFEYEAEKEAAKRLDEPIVRHAFSVVPCNAILDGISSNDNMGFNSSLTFWKGLSALISRDWDTHKRIPSSNGLGLL